VATAAARCHAVVLIGPDLADATTRLPAGLPVLRARLVQDASVTALAGRKVVAFAGIASPDKFFDPLHQAGAILAVARSFPDHHAYSKRELARLSQEARNREAVLVTTPKDAVRLPPTVRDQVTVIGVGLEWQEPGEIDQFLGKAIAAGASSMHYPWHG
jgi:tetraacyldisaccharide 4'-kinase